MKYTGLWLAAVMVAASFSLIQCSKEYSEYIDTVGSPVGPTVSKLRIVTPYYASKIKFKTVSFYEANGAKKMWLEHKGPGKNYKAFVNEVMESFKYGMVAEDYNITQLEKEVEELYNNKERTEEQISALDIKITGSFFLFTTHLLEGRIRHVSGGEFIWKKGQPHEDDVKILLSIESASDLRKEIDNLHPQSPQYEKLRKALKEYQDLIPGDTLPKITIKKAIKPGMTSDKIPLIRKKLAFMSHKDIEDIDGSEMYDKDLEESIKKFQAANGLVNDGIISGETVKQLNMSLTKRTEVIALNLERLRWQPRLTYEDEQLIVNVPEYMLRVYRDKKKALEMRVVLGTEFNSTPIFSDSLKYIVFSPTWNVPKSIFGEEFLPSLQKNPSYFGTDYVFYKNGQEIDPAEVDWSDEELDTSEYKVVQNPGNANALGNVKFVMPNNFNIYLHDTPADGLFRRNERAFSHGCIRLEKPLDLAEYLLSDQENWSRKKMTEMMKSEEPKTVNLKKSYPVHIVYHTAWVDDDGNVNFRDDLYGHDERQLVRLRRSGDFEDVITEADD
jgi:L,D-transpeptidase YcbB